LRGKIFFTQKPISDSISISMSIQGNAQSIIDTVDDLLHKNVPVEAEGENGEKFVMPVRVIDKKFLSKVVYTVGIIYCVPYILDFIIELLTLYKT